MDSVAKYIQVNKRRFIRELFELLRIPSVSAQSNNKANMEAAAKAISGSLNQIGVQHTQIFQTKGWPIVFGEKILSPKHPTILVYGHYDVQPADPIDLWDSPPFEPEIRHEKIYARGADDDKGQLFMHIKALEYMIAENRLPCNVKFVIEGEEEIGSVSLEEFCAENKALLKSDVILVSDTSMLSLETPTITTGLRGLAYFNVELRGQNRDLHSGLYGGAVLNPCNVICSMIDSLVDKDGIVQIPGFYDSVISLSTEEREILNSVPFDQKSFFNSLGLEGGFGEKGYTVIERLGVRPTCDVNGIWGGHTGEGPKTVLPSKANAKISMRLVPGQKPEEVAQQFEEYLQAIKPEEFTLKVDYLHGGMPYVLPIDSLEFSAAKKAISRTFGVEALPLRSGASIPVISVFEKILGVKSILMGFGLKSDAIHAPNENYPLKNFYKGIETIPWFYEYYAGHKLKK